MASFVQRTAPAAGSWVVIGDIPNDNSIGTVNIRIVNRSLTSPVTIRLAITAAAGTPVDSDQIEPTDLPIPAGGVLEETGIAVAAGEKVQVYTSAATVTARVFGR